MPKVRRVRSVSYDRLRSSPYPSDPKSLAGPATDDAKEWEEARCSICMEHPHNAVLLKCSSHEKGCRPYMCNTSYRHSNCLDQFRKSAEPFSPALREIPLSSEDSAGPDRAGSPCQLACPLCRGDLFGYAVVGPARAYMNDKVRSCSTESCDFIGAYTELRKHARSEHPSGRPSEVDPTRQSDWARLERERDLDDVLSLVHPGLGAEDDAGPTASAAEDRPDDFNSWISSFFVSVFRSIELMLVTRLLSASSSSEDRDSPRGGGRRPERAPRPHVEAGGSSPNDGMRRGLGFREGDSRANRLRWRRANYSTPAATRRNYHGSFQARGPAQRPRHPRWRNQRYYPYQ